MSPKLFTPDCTHVMKPLLILFLLFFALHAQATDKPAGEPLRRAIWNNDILEVRRLVALNGPNYPINGLPPLGHAMYADQPEAAQALIDAGASVHWRNAAQQSLAYIAAINKKPQMAAFFVAHGGGTAEEAQAGTLEATKIRVVTSILDGFFKNQVEEATGYLPPKGFQETWNDFSEAMDGHGPQPRMAE